MRVELEVKALLAKLLPPEREGSRVERVYRELRKIRGRRPTAGELYRMGCRPATLRESHGGWLRFVQGEGDLAAEESHALKAGEGWFEELELTPMSKSFKMVLLEALLEADALGQGLPLPQLAERCLAILRRSPELSRDLEGVTALADWRHPEPRQFLSYWTRKKNPVDAWSKSPWFDVEGDVFISRLPIPEDAKEAFLGLTRELVDYRLARYRDRQRTGTVMPSAPTTFQGAIPLPRRERLVAFPSLRAAAGAATCSHAMESAPEAELLSLPVHASGKGLFAIRASGDSMEGGAQPIRDGDWLVMRYIEAAGIGAAEGKVALVQVPDPAGYRYQVKRIVREGGKWMLRSDNRQRPSYEATEDMLPIAILEEVIPPPPPPAGDR